MSTVLKVDGMTCQHCVTAITSAVAALPGVAGVEVDLPTGAVRVAGTPDTAAVVAAIEDCGYEVDRAA